MHWVELDGLKVPVRVGGHAGLDLCNTRAGWGEPLTPPREWLKTYEALVVWSKYTELLSAPEAARLRARRDGERVLSDVRRLRTLLRTAVLHPADVRAVAGVNGFVRRAAGALRLEPGARPRLLVDPSVGVALPLLRAAWAAGDLLTSGRLLQVCVCPGADCGWLFLDAGGRRRWCAMSSCGNRAKVAAYARRRR